MSKEKQIEEMAKVIEITEQIARDAHCGLPSPRMYAKDLYWHGYRKQSDGVWTLALATYGKCMCSNCKREAPIKRADDGCLEYIKSKYCPNCGAKMKGGAE